MSNTWESYIAAPNSEKSVELGTSSERTEQEISLPDDLNIPEEPSKSIRPWVVPLALCPALAISLAILIVISLKPQEPIIYSVFNGKRRFLNKSYYFGELNIEGPDINVEYSCMKDNVMTVGKCAVSISGVEEAWSAYYLPDFPSVTACSHIGENCRAIVTPPGIVDEIIYPEDWLVGDDQVIATGPGEIIIRAVDERYNTSIMMDFEEDKLHVATASTLGENTWYVTLEPEDDISTLDKRDTIKAIFIDPSHKTLANCNGLPYVFSKDCKEIVLVPYGLSEVTIPEDVTIRDGVFYGYTGIINFPDKVTLTEDILEGFKGSITLPSLDKAKIRYTYDGNKVELLTNKFVKDGEITLNVDFAELKLDAEVTKGLKAGKDNTISARPQQPQTRFNYTLYIFDVPIIPEVVASIPTNTTPPELKCTSQWDNFETTIDIKTNGSTVYVKFDDKVYECGHFDSFRFERTDGKYVVTTSTKGVYTVVASNEIGNTAEEDVEVFAWKYEGDDAVIPPKFTKLDKDMLAGCKGISTIEIGQNIENIDAGAFDDLEKLTKIAVNKNNTMYMSDGTCLLQKENNNIVRCPVGMNEYNVPAYSHILSGAFRGCKANITLGSGVILDDGALAGYKGTLTLEDTNIATKMYNGTYSTSLPTNGNHAVVGFPAVFRVESDINNQERMSIASHLRFEAANFGEGQKSTKVAVSYAEGDEIIKTTNTCTISIKRISIDNIISNKIVSIFGKQEINKTITVSNNFTILLNNATLQRIASSQRQSAFEITEEGYLSIIGTVGSKGESATLEGKGAFNKSFFHNLGLLALSNVTCRENSTGSEGGCIANFKTISVSDCKFAKNTVTGDDRYYDKYREGERGGAIYCNGSTGVIVNSEFEDNYANNGRSCTFHDSTMLVSNCVFKGTDSSLEKEIKACSGTYTGTDNSYVALGQK